MDRASSCWASRWAGMRWMPGGTGWPEADRVAAASREPAVSRVLTAGTAAGIPRSTAGMDYALGLLEPVRDGAAARPPRTITTTAAARPGLLPGLAPARATGPRTRLRS